MYVCTYVCVYVNVCVSVYTLNICVSLSLYTDKHLVVFVLLGEAGEKEREMGFSMHRVAVGCWFLISDCLSGLGL